MWSRRRIIIYMALAVAGFLVLLGTSVARAAVPHPSKSYCTVTHTDLAETEHPPWHMVIEVTIGCLRHPRSASVFAEIEWWNPRGGHNHHGGWETAPSMGERFSPRIIALSIRDLPPPGESRSWRLASRCMIGDLMRFHQWGRLRLPDGAFTRWNTATAPEVYC